MLTSTIFFLLALLLCVIEAARTRGAISGSIMYWATALIVLGLLWPVLR